MSKDSIGYTIIETPLGNIMAASKNDKKLCSLEFIDKNNLESKLKNLEIVYKTTPIEKENEFLRHARQKLKLYFDKKLKDFDLPLDLKGTDFQKSVLQELIRIPYGQTVSYSWIARKIGRPRACRAVGMANRLNKIAIIIPCHRVIGQNRNLVGYGGNIWRKKWLLEHEGVKSLGKAIRS